jgi:hypothetical protein
MVVVLIVYLDKQSKKEIVDSIKPSPETHIEPKEIFTV